MYIQFNYKFFFGWGVNLDYNLLFMTLSSSPNIERTFFRKVYKASRFPPSVMHLNFSYNNFF